MITQRAGKDAKQIYRYVAENSYQIYANNLLDMLLKQCEMLASTPQIGVRRSDLGSDVYLFPVKKMNILYRYDESQLYVLSFYHSKKNPAYYNFD